MLVINNHNDNNFIICWLCIVWIRKKTPLEEMLGQTYSNCQIKSIIKKKDETVLTCLYKNEMMIIDTYTAGQTEEQIRDEFIDILASNDIYWE